MKRPKSVLIFGGTFDPIHCGHLSIASRVQAHFHFDDLLFLPCNQPPHKSVPMANPEQRLNMIKLALADHPIPAASVSLEEIHRPGPSYMIDTLRDLKNHYGPEVTLHLLLGQDAFLGLSAWHESETILTLAKLLLIQRPDYPKTPHAFDAGAYLVSSSEIREKVRRGERIQGLVTPGVEAYIREENLYTDRP